jgi:hypothetical protein
MTNCSKLALTILVINHTATITTHLVSRVHFAMKSALTFHGLGAAQEIWGQDVGNLLDNTIW